MHCPPAGIKAARHGIEATLRGIHCLLGETHPVASGIHCPADETHATPHRKHAITRRIRSTTRRFFPGELRGDVLHGRLEVAESVAACPPLLVEALRHDRTPRLLAVGRFHQAPPDRRSESRPRSAQAARTYLNVQRVVVDANVSSPRSSTATTSNPG